MSGDYYGACSSGVGVNPELWLKVLSGLLETRLRLPIMLAIWVKISTQRFGTELILTQEVVVIFQLINN